MTDRQAIVNALSFDIEDWFHIVEVEGLEAQHWEVLTARHTLVERYTEQILQTCESAGAKGTFFVLGWIAERYPALVRRIADAGHELASHGHMHDRVGLLGPERFAEDLGRSIDAIGSASGVLVRGYRAPSFSITPGCEWAFDVLAEKGIHWDSSLFPAARGHGGYPCPRQPHRVTAPGGAIINELPMSVWSPGIDSMRVGFSGGGYLRLFPYSVLRRAMASEAAHGRGTVVYLHPRDFAADCPRWPMSLHRRFKCYVGLASTQQKLERLLADNAWEPCGSLLDRALGPREPGLAAATPCASQEPSTQRAST